MLFGVQLIPIDIVDHNKSPRLDCKAAELHYMEMNDE